jgi:hypothetical protein
MCVLLFPFFSFCFCTEEDKQVVTAVRSVVEERPLPESELVISLWQGLMAQVDWSARPDQIEGLALREVSVRLRPTSCLFIVFMADGDYFLPSALRPSSSRFARAPRRRLRSSILCNRTATRIRGS